MHISDYIVLSQLAIHVAGMALVGTAHNCSSFTIQLSSNLIQYNCHNNNIADRKPMLDAWSRETIGGTVFGLVGTLVAPITCGMPNCLHIF